MPKLCTLHLNDKESDWYLDKIYYNQLPSSSKVAVISLIAAPFNYKVILLFPS